MSKTTFVLLRAAFLFCAVILFISAAFAQQDQPGKVTIHKLVKHDLSIPLRDMPPASRPSGVFRVHPVKMLPKHVVGAKADGAAQLSASPSINAPTVSSQFNGIGSNNGYTVQSAPPDTNGDVSSLYYVQTVNTDFAVFNKSTGAYVYGPVAINTLWSGFGGGCQTNNDGDPTVTYDQIADRWIITQFSVSSTPYLQCVAVSQTNNPTGSWYRFSYSFSTSFNDYPKLGVMVDASNTAGGAYYQTFNLFNSAGTSFLGADICAYNRAALVAGSANSMICYNAGTTYGGLLAADLDGSTVAPSGSPEFVMGIDANTTSSSLVYWTVTPNFSTSTMSHTGPTTLSVSSYTEACNGGTCVPQSGTTQQLDSLADRMMNRLQYRNFGGSPKMVGSHSVTVGSSAAARWYQFNVSGSTISVSQQGSFSPDTTYRWMPSIAMDQNQDIALGYSTSSSGLHPGIGYTGRIPSDAANTMQAETVAYTGAGSQTGSNLSRWGDYSNMVIDPSDDCTFWYTTEYIPSNGAFNWATRIVSFKFPSCGGSPTPDFSLSASPSSLTINQGSNGTSTITVTSTNSFNSAVSLSASGLPSGVTASFSPSSVTPPANGNGTSTLTLSASATATTGTATVTITGTSGSTSHTTTISLTVNSSGGGGGLTATYNSTYKAPACTTVGISCDSSASLLNGRGTMTNGNEPNASNTINASCADGNSGTYHSDESNDRLKVATNDSSNFAGGKAVTVTATVYCYSTADSMDLYYTSSIPGSGSPTWTLIKTQACSAAGVATITGSYTLPSSGTLHAVRANFRYNGSASSCSTGSYDDHDDLVFAVNQVADTTPPTTSITAPANGATVTGTVSVSASASDNVGVTKVEFYIDNVLKNTDTTSPYSFSWDTTAYSNGSHTIFSKAYDAANNVGTSTTVSVTVSNSGGGITNGGFESGNLTGWTPSGVSGAEQALASAARTGSYGDRNGLTTPTNGDSNIVQTFTAPAGVTTLSFYYKMTCPDTVTYDWVTATLKDNTTGTTTTILAKTCATNSSFVQKTATVTAGHNYTLTLTSHDDNYSSDPSYTYFDDVTLQ